MATTTLWIFTLLVLGALFSFSNAQTLQQVVEQRPELTEFWNFIRNAKITAVLGQQNVRNTLFAPNNEAMRNLPAEVLRDLARTSASGKDEKEKLISFHIVPANPVTGRPYDAQDFLDRRVETMANDAPKVFLRSFNVGSERRHYANGAKVTVADIDATNGRVHIIDSVLYPIASKNKAYSLIASMVQNTKPSESTSIFNELIDKVKYKTGSPFQYLNSDQYYVTAFVPSDESLQKILTRKRKEDLMNDEDQIIDLLNRHIIMHPVEVGGGGGNEGVKAVWHSHVLNAFIDNAIESRQASLSTIPALKGDIKPVRIANTLYVTNVCGMVKIADLPEPERSYGQDGMDQPNPQDNNNNGFGTGFGGNNNNNNNYDYENNNRDESWERPATYGTGFKVMADLTVNNGVVHIVDGLMGYIYNDAMTMIREDDLISKFRDHVLRSDDIVDKFTVVGTTVPNKMYTIFAPINSAFANIEAAGNIDLSQDDELRDKVLNLHVIEGKRSLAELGNNTRVRTLGTDNMQAHFTSDAYGTYVEVDRIRATIVRADVCVKNGIIHYIDRLLGVPYQDLFNEIRTRDQLLALNDVMELLPEFVEGNRNGLVPFEQLMKSQTEARTLFAPNDFAFNKMRSTRIGRDFLKSENADKLYFLFVRHAPVGEFYIEDSVVDAVPVPNSDNLYVLKEGQDYYVEYKDEYYGSARARIVQRNLRMTNGVVHIINNVLYIDNQDAFNVISGTSFSIPSILLLTFSLLLHRLLL